MNLKIIKATGKITGTSYHEPLTCLFIFVTIFVFFDGFYIRIYRNVKRYSRSRLIMNIHKYYSDICQIDFIYVLNPV